MKAKARPRTKPPQQRRDELMDAARHLFLRQGVGPTTIEQITSGADVAKGTFYLHFSSKEDLLAALGEQFAEQHLIRLTTALAARSEGDWTGKLATWAEACVAFYLDSVQLHDMLFHESRAPTREGLVDNVIIDHLTLLLKAGATAGAWSIDDPRFTAVFLFGGMHGIVDDAYLKEKRLLRGRLIRRLQRICFGAVGLSSGSVIQKSRFPEVSGKKLARVSISKSEPA
jgi:AcrR family transcriptional regulator